MSLASSEEQPEAAARKLTETAFTRGSADNITCIVVKFHHDKADPNDTKAPLKPTSAEVQVNPKSAPSDPQATLNKPDPSKPQGTSDQNPSQVQANPKPSPMQPQATSCQTPSQVQQNTKPTSQAEPRRDWSALALRVLRLSNDVFKKVGKCVDAQWP